MMVRISSFRSRAFLPSALTGSPMTMRMVPGFFTIPRLGQNVPALCDTGTTRLPVAVASSAPLTPYLRFSPTGTRVPSGKITTPNPCPEPLLPLVDHLIHRSVPRAAIDRDRVQPLQAPPHEGYPQELMLEYPHMGREYREQCDGLPGGGVFAHHDVIAVRNALAAFHAVL